MKPSILLAESTLSDRSVLSLRQHDGQYSLRIDGETLMSTKAYASEQRMAELAFEALGPKRMQRVLVGGFGFGFTVRRVLELCEPTVQVDVAELLPQIVDWNRQHLHEVNGGLVDDPRVHMHLEDVQHVLAATAAQTYDAILVDVDNGPAAFVDRRNQSMYTNPGIKSVFQALRRGGRAVYWSAVRDDYFAQKLEHAGFSVQIIAAKAYPGAKRASHTLFCADRAD